jgi:hypothetical protein
MNSMKGMKFVNQIPSEAGKVVGMTVYKDQVIVAAEYKLYRLVDDQLRIIPFQTECGVDTQ